VPTSTRAFRLPPLTAPPSALVIASDVPHPSVGVSNVLLSYSYDSIGFKLIVIVRVRLEKCLSGARKPLRVKSVATICQQLSAKWRIPRSLGSGSVIHCIFMYYKYLGSRKIPFDAPLFGNETHQVRKDLHLRRSSQIETDETGNKEVRDGWSRIAGSAALSLLHRPGSARTIASAIGAVVIRIIHMRFTDGV
jgi:hypothetical protein